MQQTAKDPIWKDEAGQQIPYSRITKAERLMERESARLLKEGKSINSLLAAYKEKMAEVCDQVYVEFMKEKNNGGKESKGNFTWFNFDRSTKVEISINERIEFDDLTIKAAKDKLDEFLDQNVTSADDIVKQMITDAFSNTKGRLDTKKVTGLLRYKSKVKSPLYHEAMDLLEQAIRRPDSKKYCRIYERKEDGSYTLIDLNISSI